MGRGNPTQRFGSEDRQKPIPNSGLLPRVRGLTFNIGKSKVLSSQGSKGLGLSILSARAIDTEVKAGLLKALKVKGLSMSRNFFLIRNKLRIASPSCQAMLDFLLTSAGEQKN